MNTLGPSVRSTAVTDIYTDLQGLQGLRREENTNDALKKVAEQFESMFLQMMLKNMRSANAVFEKDSMFQSQESGFYRDMQDNQMALTMASGKGIGIAESLYRQMRRDYGNDETRGLERGNDTDAIKTETKGFSVTDLPRASRSGDEMRRHAAYLASRAEVDAHSNNSKSQLRESGSSAPATSSTSGEDRVALSESPEEFIDLVYQSAQKVGQELGVAPELLIAQAALETGWGSKVLGGSNGTSTNNLFNIKADTRWTGNSVEQNTQEFIGGKETVERANFRAYESVQASFADYRQFISSSERYKNALENAENPESYMQKLSEAGYATDPKYAQKVLSVYERVVDYTNAKPSDSDSGSGGSPL